MRAKAILGIIVASVLLGGCNKMTVDADILPENVTEKTTEISVATSVDAALAADDPVLRALAESRENVKAGSESLYLANEINRGDGVFRVTPQIISEAVEIILSGNPEKVTIPLRSFTDVENYLMLGYDCDNGDFFGMQFYEKPTEMPDAVVLSMQFGDEMYEYTVSQECFDRLEQLALSCLHMEDAAIEGDFLRYDLGLQSERTSQREVIEVGGKLLFLWEKEQDYYVEVFDTETKKVEKVWEHNKKSDSFLPTFKIENIDYGEYDYRLVSENSIEYRSSLDADKSLIFSIPVDIPTDDVWKSLRYSMDVLPEENLLSYTTEEGVFVQEIGADPSTAKMFLDCNKISEKLQDTPLEFGNYYAMPVLHGGGMLSAVVVHPGSQSGSKAITLVNIDSGEQLVYENVFSAMVADVDYIGKSTVVAIAMNNYTLIDVKTGESVTKNADDFWGRTVDYERWVDLDMQKNSEGVPEGVLGEYTQDENENYILWSELLKCSGEGVYLSGVTVNFATVQCKNADENYIAIVRR